MTLVKDLMSSKVIAIQDSQRVTDAITLMARDSVGFVMVTGDDGQLVGVLSDTDLVRKVMYKKLNPDTLLIRQIMFPSPMTTAPDAELVDAVDLLCTHHLKRLPVIENSRIVGVLSISDAVLMFMEYKKKLLDLALNF